MRMQTSIGEVETYIGICCREWVMVHGFMGGTCGLCGERPEYLRPDEHDERERNQASNGSAA